MKSKKSKKTAKDYYVDPDEMWAELDDFYKLVEDSDNPEEEEMSPELGRMLDDIATKLGFMSKFINYSYKEEMQGDGRVKMVKAVYDRNFTLWKTVPCTEILVENGRPYVVVFLEKKGEWDDKRTYLKPWDTVDLVDEPLTYPDPDWEPECQLESPCKGKCKCPDQEAPLLQIITEDGQDCINTVTVRNNPFSYFTKIAFHAFVNRIKKEKKVGEILHEYQEKVYEDMYASGNGWENVRRQRLEDEENYYNDDECEDSFYKEENEVEIEDDS